MRCTPTAAATGNGIVLQSSRLAMHHDDRRRVRLHLDGGRELRELRAATAAINGRLLLGGRVLRDDPVGLHQHWRRVSRRGDFLHARPVRRPANRFLLRRRRLLLRDHRRRLLRHVEQWRQLHAQPVRRTTGNGPLLPRQRLLLRHHCRRVRWRAGRVGDGRRLHNFLRDVLWCVLPSAGLHDF